MQEKYKERLAELKTELKTGQDMLADMEKKKADLEQTLLRISGAIQVLEEMLEEQNPVDDTPATTDS